MDPVNETTTCGITDYFIFPPCPSPQKKKKCEDIKLQLTQSFVQQQVVVLSLVQSPVVAIR